ncbi:MAG: hypothetical protein CL844_03730 [Crocinitomicaceae bacterium]|nr:hypothetical protein [Crocinitomicaceae bacterium]
MLIHGDRVRGLLGPPRAHPVVLLAHPGQAGRRVEQRLHDHREELLDVALKGDEVPLGAEELPRLGVPLGGAGKRHLGVHGVHLRLAAKGQRRARAVKLDTKRVVLDAPDLDAAHVLVHRRARGVGRAARQLPEALLVALAPEVVGVQTVQVVEPRDGVLALHAEAHARAHVGAVVKRRALGVIKGQVARLEGVLALVAKERARGGAAAHAQERVDGEGLRAVAGLVHGRGQRWRRPRMRLLGRGRALVDIVGPLRVEPLRRPRAPLRLLVAAGLKGVVVAQPLGHEALLGQLGFERVLAGPDDPRLVGQQVTHHPDRGEARRRRQLEPDRDVAVREDAVCVLPPGLVGHADLRADRHDEAHHLRGQRRHQRPRHVHARGRRIVARLSKAELAERPFHARVARRQHVAHTLHVNNTLLFTNLND